jgi:prepilin-type N-terminal cleavage/methylation domain-containing protein
MSRQHKSGFSLIEVMIGMLILAVLVVGAATIMYQTGGIIQRQQNKREAIVAASTVLERYWSMTYADLEGLDGTKENKSTEVNGISMDYEVSIDAQIDSDGDYCMEIVVDIDHMGSTDDAILTARRYPHGLSKASVVP